MVVGDAEQQLTRAERRQRTEARILGAARDLFARLGYERTTIRAVATRAEVDPALVMQYFSSKDELFRQAARFSPDAAFAGDIESLAEHLLTTIGLKLGELPQTSLAALRSALTHPEAAHRVRDVQRGQIEKIGAALATDDAELRAALIVALMTGISIQRHLIPLSPLDAAPREQITDLLRPCVEALLADDRTNADGRGSL
jgi:AcrR family transcriptional regulator